MVSMRNILTVVLQYRQARRNGARGMVL
jgi:hypothetical protein